MPLVQYCDVFVGASRYSVGKMEPAQYGTVTGSAHSAHRPPMVRSNYPEVKLYEIHVYNHCHIVRT